MKKNVITLLWLAAFTQSFAQTPCSFPVQIVGHQKLCLGDTSQLTPSSGGIWASNNPTVATVNSTGKVTSVGQGTVDFTFTGSGGCVSTTSTITVSSDWLGTEYTSTSNLGGVTVDNSGNIYFGDYSTGNVLMTAPGSGTTSVYSSGIPSPYGMVFDNAGNLIVCSYGSNKVVKIPPGGGTAINYVTGLNGPSSIAKYNGDTLVVQNYFDNKIYMILPGGGATGSSQVPLIATLTGNRGSGLGVYNNKDLIALVFNSNFSGTECYRIAASSNNAIISLGHLSINTPIDLIKLPGQDEFYLTAYYSNNLHKLDANAMTTIIVAGNGVSGNSDGLPLSSMVTSLYYGALDQDGTLWFTTSNNKKLRYYSECHSCVTPTINTNSITNLCVGAATSLNPSTGGAWSSSNPTVASISTNGQIMPISTGSVHFTYMSNGGCSATTTDMTVLSPTTGTDIQTACGSYTWIDGNTYTVSNNTATYVLPNAAGCDSTITLNLTINTVNTNVTQNGITLSSNISGAIYQWVDCNNNMAAIIGETNQSFTATQNGDYALVVTHNACTDTSSCYTVTSVGFTENSLYTNVSIYPNPTSGLLNIETKEIIDVKIVNLLGEVVRSFKLKQGSNAINVSNLTKGIYFVQSKNGGSVKFIKE